MKRHRGYVPIVQIGLILALIAFSLASAFRPVPAAAARTSISVSKQVAAPGETVAIKGSGFQPGDSAVVVVVASEIASSSAPRPYTFTTTVLKGGAISTALKVPSGSAAGIYSILVQDAHANAASQTFQVPVQLQLKSGSPGLKMDIVPGLRFSITGTGFKAGEQVTFKAAFPLFQGNSLTETKIAAADNKGNAGPVTMQVPWRAQDGQVSLTATGQQSGQKAAVTATLNVVHKPFLQVAPNQTAGKNLFVTGVGFVPGDQVTVSLTIARTGTSSVTLNKTAKADSQGDVTVYFFLPRNVREGSYTLAATAALLHVHISTTFKVTAVAAVSTPTKAPTPKATPKATATPTATPTPVKVAISVAPIAVIPGANAQVLGSGFPAGDRVTVSVPVKRTNGVMQTLQVTVTADSKGAFATMLHTPGDAQGGSYQVTAKGQSGKSATGTLKVDILKPSVVTVPAQAIPGTAVTVSGFGFSSGARVTITIHGQMLTTVTASGTGAFKTSVTIPKTLATGMYTLVAQESGRRAAIGLQVYRTISTYYYFASLYTGQGFHEYLIFVNTSEIQARVTITYQLASGGPKRTTITIPAHSRLTHDVNADLGGGVNAAAVISTDVPISAERMVVHANEGSLDPGTTTPSKIWYFANGNTSHQYQEYISIQNPTNNPVQVNLQVQPTHSRTFTLHRPMRPQSRITVNLNKFSHDAIGVIVTANGPVVANRTIFIHNGITSKTGITKPQTHWYFAAGSANGNTRNWIGVINTTNQPSTFTLYAYSAQGAQVATIKKVLKPYDRQGFLMNRLAGQTEVAVVVSTTQPSISEQSTFVNGNHNAGTDTFGVTAPQKTAEFAEATTWSGQDNLLAIFNPNMEPAPVVVEYLTAHGTTEQQTYVVEPLAHQFIDVGKVVHNSQLGIMVASSVPVVTLDRQLMSNGLGAMTSLGTQS